MLAKKLEQISTKLMNNARADVRRYIEKMQQDNSELRVHMMKYGSFLKDIDDAI